MDEFLSETRACGKCTHFHPDGRVIGICGPKWMFVTKDMHVYYRASEGTCWEAPEQRTDGHTGRTASH